MDIKIPHSLLTKQLTTNADPEEIAKCLSLCGPTVDHLEKVAEDYIYHIEVITNRVDSASVSGIAKEAAAILPEFGYQAEYQPVAIEPINQKNLPNLDIEIINNPSLNPRISAVKIGTVSVKSSPKWLIDALEKSGSRSLNNIIDITNYVMFELGHPVHAFDYDRLTTKKIIVREAKAGEKIITLDDKEHKLVGGEIVYDDGTGNIVDLPGIMGTKNSVITADTKNVLLWLESNEKKRIRKASLKHQIRSHAAILNEKGVDPELIMPALLRAAKLMCDQADATIASKIYDFYTNPVKPHSLSLDLLWLHQFTGITLSQTKITSILTRLGFGVEQTHKHTLECVVPTSRKNDILIREDLAEEIMRVHGYFRLPSILPITNIPAIPTAPHLTLETKIRHLLVKLGATEIYNYSLVSKTLIGQDSKTAFKLINPLSEDFLYMRHSLLPSLREARQRNQGSFDQPYILFEIANVYHKHSSKLPAKESSHLAIIWNQIDFRHVKGFIETFSRQLNLPPDIITIKTLDATFAIECNLEQLYHQIDTTHRFTPIPTTQPIIEDLTFTNNGTKYKHIISTITAINPLIESVQLKDIFNQNYTLTIIYRDNQRTLTTQEIAPIRKNIVNSLKKIGLNLVGSLPE